MATPSKQLHRQPQAIDAGGKTLKRSFGGRLLTKQQELEVIQLYVIQHETASEIAKAYGVSVKTIYRTLSTNNVHFRQDPSKQTRLLVEKKEEVKPAEEVKAPIKQIRWRRKRLTKAEEKLVCSAYKRKEPIGLILSKFGIKEGHLYSILTRHDVPRAYRSVKNQSKNPNENKEIKFIVKPLNLDLNREQVHPEILPNQEIKKQKSIIARLFGRLFGF